MPKSYKNIHIAVVIQGKVVEHGPVWPPRNPKSGARQRFLEDGIDKVLDMAAERLDKKYPNDDFRMVKIGPASFKFIHCGLREVLPVVIAGVEDSGEMDGNQAEVEASSKQEQQELSISPVGETSEEETTGEYERD